MKAAELKELIAQGKAPVLFDVREAAEAAKGEKFEGAKTMTAGRLYVEATKDGLPKDKKIVLICGAEGEGPEAAQILRDNGYDVECLETEGVPEPAAEEQAESGPEGEDAAMQ